MPVLRDVGALKVREKKTHRRHLINSFPLFGGNYVRLIFGAYGSLYNNCIETQKLFFRRIIFPCVGIRLSKVASEGRALKQNGTRVVGLKLTVCLCSFFFVVVLSFINYEIGFGSVYEYFRLFIL